MDLEERLVLKVRLGEEVRKMPIHNEEMTYDELILMMERVFKHRLVAGDEIVIKYMDEDNDLITITDDSDLAFAMESSNILKLVLSVQSEEGDAKKSERKEFNNLDMKTIRKELQMIRDQTNKLLDKIIHFSNGTNINSNGSGRASASEVNDYHGVGGKEFDPLSVGTHASQFQSVERTSSSASIGSQMRKENHMSKDTFMDSREIHRPSPTIIKNQNMTPPVSSSTPNSQINQSMPSAVTGAFNAPPQSMRGQSMPPQMVGASNMQTHQTMGRPNMTPPTMTGPQNTGALNAPPQCTSGEHNMPPSTGGLSNMPPSFTTYNPSSQGDASTVKMSPYPFQGPTTTVQRPALYPPGPLPPQGQPRPGLSNYAPPQSNMTNPQITNGQQIRPNIPPMAGQGYFNPQQQQQPGSKIFNPQMQQNNAYGGFQSMK